MSTLDIYLAPEYHVYIQYPLRACYIPPVYLPLHLLGFHRPNLLYYTGIVLPLSANTCG